MATSEGTPSPGRPKGRPKGTGKLGGGEERRLTIRLSDDLYTRFAAFAEGRHFHRGSAQYSDCARDALEHYLACPHKRLTIISAVPAMDEREPKGNEPASHLSSVDNRPTEKETASRPPAENIRPTRKKATPSITAAEIASLEDMPLVPDAASDQAVAEVPAMAQRTPLDPEPTERDSVSWRRWFALAEVQRASGPLTPDQILKELGAIADDGLAVSKVLVRADLEFWCKAGLVTRAASGGYVALAAPRGARPRKRQAAPIKRDR